MSERFRVGLKTVDRILIEGVIDKNARYVFTHGYCSELAHALHERTDGLVVRWSPYCPTAGSSMKCRHCTRAWVLGRRWPVNTTTISGLRFGKPLLGR